jgi:hypothetical protein
MENETNPNQQISESPKKSGKSAAVGFLAFLILLLLGVLGFLGWKYYQQNLAAEEIQQQLVADKDSITQNLKNLVVEYDEMQTSNDSLNRQLVAEREKVRGLYREIQTLKTVSYAKIKEYQRELGTLRAIMKGLTHDVDSLNTMNQVLVAENIKVKAEVSTTKKKVKTLEQKTEELSSTIEKGSVINTRNVVVSALSRKGKEVTRARRAEKLIVCFTLTENAIAKAGSRYVYLRILGPDEVLLAKSETDLFDFQGQKIVYSAKREVDYQNQDVDMCIYYDNSGELLEGKYQVTLYLDGSQAGEGEVVLK